VRREEQDIECLKPYQNKGRKFNLHFSLTAEIAKTAEKKKIIFLYWAITYDNVFFAHWLYFQNVTQARCLRQQGSESGVSFYIARSSASSAFSAVRNIV